MSHARSKPLGSSENRGDPPQKAIALPGLGAFAARAMAATQRRILRPETRPNVPQDDVMQKGTDERPTRGV